MWVTVVVWIYDHIHIIRMLTDAGPDLEDETRDDHEKTTKTFGGPRAKMS